MDLIFVKAPENKSVGYSGWKVKGYDRCRRYFASDFLYGLTCGYSLEKCAKIGSILSGNVIQVIGTTISPERWDEIKLNINKVLAE